MSPRQGARAAALWLLAACAAPASTAGPSGSPAPEGGYDVVIRNGRVLDGAGNPWVAADVAIRDGRIAKIGVVRTAGAGDRRAPARYVSPGWIDMMDQSGAVLPRTALAENKLREGVTTAHRAARAERRCRPDSVADYFARLERQGHPHQLRHLLQRGPGARRRDGRWRRRAHRRRRWRR